MKKFKKYFNPIFQIALLEPTDLLTRSGMGSEVIELDEILFD